MFRRHAIRLGGAAVVLLAIAVSVPAVQAQHYGGGHGVRHGARRGGGINHYSYRFSYSPGYRHYRPYYYGAYGGGHSYRRGHYTPFYGGGYYYNNHYAPGHGYGYYSGNHYSPHLSLRFGH